jgi:hypothetical protein
VLNVQPDEFGTAQRAGEAEEKHRLVAGAGEIRPAGPAQLADLGRGDGCGSSRRTAMLASDAAERLADRRMLGVEGMAGNATRTGNGGNSTAQSRHRITFTGSGQIGPNHLGCCGNCDETVPIAPGFVVREVGRISRQGCRGIRGVLVGLRLGERYCCARGGRFGVSEAGELALARRGECISHNPVYHIISRDNNPSRVLYWRRKSTEPAMSGMLAKGEARSDHTFTQIQRI